MSSAKELLRRGTQLFDHHGAVTVVVFLLYWAAASLAIASFMDRWSFRENEDRYDLPSMLEYRAERPFVYRALIPIVVNSCSRIVPQDWKRQLTDKLDQISDLRARFFKGEGRIPWTTDFSFAYRLIYYLDFASLLFTLVVLRAIVQRLPRVSAAAAAFTPLAFCVILPTAFLVGGYFYDFPELLFLTLGYLAALQGRYVVLCLIVPLAAANKETAILLPTLVSPFLWAHYGSRKTLSIVAVSTGLGVAAVLGVRTLLDLTRGTPVIVHLLHNIRFWLLPSSYFQFTDILAPGIPFPKPGNVLVLGAMAAVVAGGWKFMTALERRLLVISAVVNIPLALFFGAPAEFRNLSLMFVPLVIACARFFSEMQTAGKRETVEING